MTITQTEIFYRVEVISFVESSNEIVLALLRPNGKPEEKAFIAGVQTFQKTMKVFLASQKTRTEIFYREDLGQIANAYMSLMDRTATYCGCPPSQLQAFKDGFNAAAEALKQGLGNTSEKGHGELVIRTLPPIPMNLLPSSSS
ncbi:hypothetical protein KKF11_03530 [Patescibacteria group bacterium]|nr:hypothetical protein [Patescibacteria group bacterium]